LPEGSRVVPSEGRCRLTLLPCFSQKKVGRKGRVGQGYYCCPNFKGRWDRLLNRFVVVCGCDFFCWARMPAEPNKTFREENPVASERVGAGKKRPRRMPDEEFMSKEDYYGGQATKGKASKALLFCFV
jgi:hypothetical protein